MKPDPRSRPWRTAFQPGACSETTSPRSRFPASCQSGTKSTFEIAGEEIVLRVGDAASFRGDIVHSYRTDGATTARFALAVYAPSEGGR